jgi:sulfur-carrier protein adenylyltransferase/sulfurtransferase
MTDFEKFSRQMMLLFIEDVGQKKLQNSHIVVVGCGGLGCPLLLYLAASGVGTLTIIDNDTVSISNLHRQILFSHHDIGTYKAVTAAQKLSFMHPDTHIIPVTKRLDTQLALELCSNVDLVIDGTDSFLSKYILSEICPTLLTASVVGMTGYVAGFTKNIPYRAIFPTIPDNAPNCSQTGVLGSVAGMIGTFLATEAIKIIVNHEKTIINQLITLDLNSLHFSKTKLSSHSSNLYHKLPDFEFITLESDYDGTLIDVREVHELVNAPLVKNALSIPLSQLNIDDILAIQKPIFKCHTGRRAERIALKVGLLSDRIKNIKIMIP